MVKYWDRLHPLMEAKRVSTQDLATTLGVSFQAVVKVRDGGAFGSKNNIAAAEYFGVSPSWLATGKGNPSLTDGMRQIHPTNAVPVLSWREASNWQKVINSLRGDFEKILVNMPTNRYTYALRITDDSNLSQFPIGAWVVIEPTETPVNEKWCIVDDSSGQASLKQLVIDGSTKYLRSDKFPIKEMGKNAKFCGTAKQIIFQNNL